MAYADVQSKKLDPASLAATIAINGAVVGALLLAAPEVSKIPEKIIETYTVIERKPPEAIPETKASPESKTKISRPEPEVPIVTSKPSPDIDLGDDPFVPLGKPGGSGSGPLIFDPPVTPPAPVMTGAEIDPRYMRDFQPAYPSSKIRLEEEGRVTVRILVGANGRVLQLQPVGNPDAQFLAATRKQALSKWRFKPATRDGVPIEAWREISVRFELNS